MHIQLDASFWLKVDHITCIPWSSHLKLFSNDLYKAYDRIYIHLWPHEDILSLITLLFKSSSWEAHCKFYIDCFSNIRVSFESIKQLFHIYNLQRTSSCNIHALLILKWIIKIYDRQSSRSQLICSHGILLSNFHSYQIQ